MLRILLQENANLDNVTANDLYLHNLSELKKMHGHTLIQDSQSSIVFGMAAVAQSLGAVDKVIDLDKFAEYFMLLTKQSLVHK